MFQVPLHVTGNNRPFLTVPDQRLEMETLRHTEDFRGSVKAVKLQLNVLEGAKDTGAPHSNLP